jgi:hypothetical protein
MNQDRWKASRVKTALVVPPRPEWSLQDVLHSHVTAIRYEVQKRIGDAYEPGMGQWDSEDRFDFAFFQEAETGDTFVYDIRLIVKLDGIACSVDEGFSTSFFKRKYTSEDTAGKIAGGIADAILKHTPEPY